MLLVCDIGNSNIVFGIYDGEELLSHWRLTSRYNATIDEYRVMMGTLIDRYGPPGEVDSVIISSVVPPLTQKVGQVIELLIGVKPMVVGPGIKTGLDIQYDDPREVGADRIVNAVAALDRHKPPLVIVDFGTATTFDVVLAPNIYHGGIIVPGLNISRDALIDRTAMLPKVEIKQVQDIVGRNTADSIRSGLFSGTGAMVDGLVDRISEELDIEPVVIATGGFAGLIQDSSNSIEIVEADLTLWGLYQIWQKNTG